MATKEDILEQIVEEYLVHQGYFVQHNIKFLPPKDHPDFVPKQDSNHSDIDVVGYHPTLEGDRKVLAVSCKSWQSGFDPKTQIEAIRNNKIVAGKEAWRRFRELVKPKWSAGFINAVRLATGTDHFTYVTAVTKLTGDKSIWEDDPSFKNLMNGNPIMILTLQDMVLEIQGKLTKTLAATEIGRLLQLFQAANMKVRDG